MHFNSDRTTGFFRFFFNFTKTVVLILLYQLPFLQSGGFPGIMNGIGVQLDLENLPSVPDVETHLKVEACRGTFREY